MSESTGKAANARFRIAPEAFSIPDERNLGNPAVVSRLVGEFCARCEAMTNEVRDKVIDPAAVKVEIGQQIRRLANIFGGRDPGYTIIRGWHDVSLAGQLIADLGPFWRKQHAEWNDDAIAVLFDWLAAHVIEQTHKCQGDDLLLGVKLKPSIQYAVTSLLGINRRAGS
jgi:hypothetical protein